MTSRESIFSVNKLNLNREEAARPTQDEAEDEDEDSSDMVEMSRFDLLMRDANKAFMRQAESLSMPDYLKLEIYGDRQFKPVPWSDIYLEEHPYQGTIVKKETAVQESSPRIMLSLETPMTNESP